MNYLGTLPVAGIGNGDLDEDGGLGQRNLKVVVVESSVREAVTEWKESRPTNLVVEAVADINILAVQDAAAFGPVVEEGLIIFNVLRERV